MAGDVRASFIQLTGADAEVAKAFLEQTHGNLEAALSLFFDGADPAVAAPAPAPSRRAATRVYDDDDGWEQPPPVHGDDGIRAPMQARVEQLSATHGSLLPAARYAPDGMPMRSAPQPTVHRAFRNFREERADMSRASSSSSSGAAPSRNLATLLRPPTELLFAGTFDEAREVARRERKWLLVNIQVDEEFDCWRLNRDTWKYDGVAEMIRASFIFWQQQWDFDATASAAAGGAARRAGVVIKSVNPHAREFMTRYQLPHEFPVILIIDPRTREQVHIHTGFWSSTDFMDRVSDFISSHSFDSDAVIPVTRSRDPKFKPSIATAAAAASSAAPGRSSVPAPVHIEPMDEDAALAAAIAASLEPPPAPAAAAASAPAAETEPVEAFDFDDDDYVDYAGMVDNGNAAASPAPATAAQKRSRDDPPLESVGAGRKRARAPGAPRVICSALLPDVDASNTDVARLQVRLPDGTRVQRSFKADAPIAQLFYVISCVLHAPHAVTTRMVAAVEAAAAREGDEPHLNELTRDRFVHAVEAVTPADIVIAPSIDPVLSVVDVEGAAPARGYDVKRPYPAVSIIPDALAGKTFREAGLTSAMLHVSWE